MASRGARVAARRRAAVLLCLLAATALSWLLALLPGVPWGVSVVPTALLLLDLAALRLTARERALREGRSRRPVPPVRQHRAAAGAPVPPSAAPTAGSPGGDAQGPEDGPVLPAAARTPAQDEESSAEEGHTWTPVPVPPPTYTLKPMAPRTSNGQPPREDVAARQEEAPRVEDQVLAATAATVPPDGLKPPSEAPAAPARPEEPRRVVTAQGGVPGERPGTSDVIDLRTVDLRTVDLRTVDLRNPFDARAQAVSGTAIPGGSAGAGGGQESEGDRAVHELDLDSVLDRRRAVNG